jgi:GTPase SAR1 family protein
MGTKDLDIDHLSGKPILFMGWGANGKTSTIRNLMGNSFEKSSPTTFGIRGIEHNLDGEEVLFLDYPGQYPAFRLASYIIGDIREAIFVLVMQKNKLCYPDGNHESDYEKEEAGHKIKKSSKDYFSIRTQDMPTIITFTYRDSHGAEQVMRDQDREAMRVDSELQVENSVENGAESLRNSLMKHLANIEPIKISLVELYASQITDLINNENDRYEKGAMGFYTPEEFDEFWNFLVENLGKREGFTIPLRMHAEILSILRTKGVIHNRDGKIYIPLGAKGNRIDEYYSMLKEMPVYVKLGTDFAPNLLLGLKLACADRIIEEGTDSFRLFLKLDGDKIVGVTTSKDDEHLIFHSNLDSADIIDFIIKIAPVLKEWTHEKITPLIGCSCEDCSKPENHRRHFFNQNQIDFYTSDEEKRIMCYESAKTVDGPQVLIDVFSRLKEALSNDIEET